MIPSGSISFTQFFKRITEFTDSGYARVFIFSGMDLEVGNLLFT